MPRMEAPAPDSKSIQTLPHNLVDFPTQRQSAHRGHTGSFARSESFDQTNDDQDKSSCNDKNRHGQNKTYLCVALNMPLVKCTNSQKHNKDRKKADSRDKHPTSPRQYLKMARRSVRSKFHGSPKTSADGTQPAQRSHRTPPHDIFIPRSYSPARTDCNRHRGACPTTADKHCLRQQRGTTVSLDRRDSPSPAAPRQLR